MPYLSDIAEALLDLLPRYGYLVLGAGAFAGAVGAPLPLGPLFLAAGALSAGSGLRFPLVAVVALASVIAGDCVGYGLGHAAGRRLLRRLGPKVGLSEQHLSKAQRAVRRWAGWSVWLSRWLLTPFASAINLLAGANEYPFRRFLALNAFGNGIWVLGYLTVGHIFGENASGPAATAAKLIAGLVALLLVGGGALAARCLFHQRRGHSTARDRSGVGQRQEEAAVARTKRAA